MDALDDLIRELALEQDSCHSIVIPEELGEKRRLLRTLMNLRPPLPAAPHLLDLQDAELGRQLIEKGMVRVDEIKSISSDPRLKLWWGDITRLRVDAIVNAANSQMLGCFVPLHKCIDNAIHSAAGLQLRTECNDLMKAQGHPEPSGSAKITRGYNLPAGYVIHTVGPIIENGKVSQEDEYQLASCYQSCLQLADENKLRSIAFCCISTGEYRFQNQLAAEIALRTVRKYFGQSYPSGIETVVFNVFRDIDYTIYSKLLQREQG
jgi:O-acetyl-ADP-ribose deacetylase (regulator of RNase III)